MLCIEDIQTFFVPGTRNNNDVNNKTRERVLKYCLAPPTSFLEDAIYGPLWRIVGDGWKAILDSIPSTPSSIILHPKGGRGSHNDFNVEFIGSESSRHCKVEFKYGATSIDRLPQFLSLQVKFPLFAVTYDGFYYDNYLRQYVAIDSGITETIPPRETYLSLVTGLSNVSPFFNQLKEREEIDKRRKAAIVNTSINEYLRLHASTLNLTLLSSKLLESQRDKVFILYRDGSFHTDRISTTDMTSLTYEGVKNGNSIQIRGENVIFSMLLRWRNHKGILNPAWQISMKRLLR